MTIPDTPASAAVLGAGTIGSSAAVWLAAHGIPVTIVTRRPQALAEVPVAAEHRLARLVALGALAEDRADAARRNLRVRLGLPTDEAFSLIYEAVGEDLAAKRAALAGAEASLATDGILVTSTSSLPLDELAAPLDAPERFAAWHWFNPADLMELVEIIPGGRTDDVVIATLRRWSASVGKRAIVLRRQVPGFVANRLQYALLREAYALVEAGVCMPEDIDVAVTAGLGARWAAIGPFASMDLAGLAVHAAVAGALFPALSNETAVPDTLARLRRAGAGGARAGQGLLGAYGPDRVDALEDLRDRTLVGLKRRFR